MRQERAAGIGRRASAATRAGARIAAALAVVAVGASCRSGIRGAGPEMGMVTLPPTGAWTISRREHIDSWLHAYAMIEDDTTSIPYFKPGYVAHIAAVKARGNVLTQLDVNRDRLRARLRQNPNLISGQFLPLYFENAAQFNKTIDLFLRAEGNPRAAGDQQTRGLLALFAGVFNTPADRDWLQQFAAAMRDENAKFYDGYWQQAESERSTVTARIDSLWLDTYYNKFKRYLNNSQLGLGLFILSLPLDGEGRTVSGNRQTNTIVVEFPDSASQAVNAIYVFAHEASTPVTTPAIHDNITPAEQRAGLGDRYTSAAAVQCGAMLIKRVAPELLDGYAHFYLAAAKRSPATGDPLAQLQQAFPLPQTIRDAMSKQLDTVLGGV